MLPLRSCEQIPQKEYVGNAGFGVLARGASRVGLAVGRLFSMSRRRSEPEISVFDLRDGTHGTLADRFVRIKRGGAGG